MGWAIVLEGRTDPAGILLLFDDREEAESIAWELRRRGHPVVVLPYEERSPTQSQPADRSSSGAVS